MRSLKKATSLSSSSCSGGSVSSLFGRLSSGEVKSEELRDRIAFKRKEARGVASGSSRSGVGYSTDVAKIPSTLAVDDAGKG